MITFEQLFKKKNFPKNRESQRLADCQLLRLFGTHLLMPLSRKSEEEEEECETFLQNNSQPTTLKLLETGYVHICFAKESRAVCSV